MDYAHQGIEVKQLPGVQVPPARQPELVAETKSKSDDRPPPRPITLTQRGAEILVQVERMMDDANRALGPLPAALSVAPKKQAEAPQKVDATATALEDKAFDLGRRN